MAWQWKMWSAGEESVQVVGREGEPGFWPWPDRSILVMPTTMRQKKLLAGQKSCSQFWINPDLSVDQLQSCKKLLYSQSPLTTIVSWWSLKCDLVEYRKIDTLKWMTPLKCFQAYQSTFLKNVQMGLRTCYRKFSGVVSNRCMLYGLLDLHALFVFTTNNCNLTSCSSWKSMEHLWLRGKITWLCVLSFAHHRLRKTVWKWKRQSMSMTLQAHLMFQFMWCCQYVFLSLSHPCLPLSLSLSLSLCSASLRLTITT